MFTSLIRIARPRLGAVALVILSTAAVVAQDGRAQDGGEACATHVVDEARETALLDRLGAAPDAEAASKVNARLWALWTDAPDAHAQELLDSGMARIRLGDLRKAVSALDALVAYCPRYAEGYNQRAFARYLQEDFLPALADLEVALTLSPRHVGALSGKALTLMALGRDAAALEALEAALDLNPWLAERTLLPDLVDRVGARDL
jgi:tetratricopeptide (TPR) repeat protein